MFFDAFSIMTNGLHDVTGVAISNGFISITKIGTITEPKKKATGSSDGAVFDDYKTPFEYIIEKPKVILSVNEIADIIKDIDDTNEEIVIMLEYRPKSVNNSKIECTLLEKKITAELIKTTTKRLKVEVLYIGNN